MVFIGKDEQLATFLKFTKNIMLKEMMVAQLSGKKMLMLKLWIEKIYLIDGMM